jgi:soluble lytic murein transglycosylase-like protein
MHAAGSERFPSMEVMRNVSKLMNKKITTGALSLAAGLGLAAGASAAVQVDDGAGGKLKPAVPATDKQFDRWAETGKLYARYDELLGKARKRDVAPQKHVLRHDVVSEKELRKGIADLRNRLAAARAAAAAAAEAEATAEATGVASGTLESIAACESGGDPGAVNAAGYYGKYQFDMQTWQSVGGSGNPAAASEAEQDQRAAILYSRAGSSPWPVCGQ